MSRRPRPGPQSAPEWPRPPWPPCARPPPARVARRDRTPGRPARPLPPATSSTLSAETTRGARSIRRPAGRRAWQRPAPATAPWCWPRGSPQSPPAPRRPPSRGCASRKSTRAFCPPWPPRQRRQMARPPVRARAPACQRRGAGGRPTGRKRHLRRPRRIARHLGPHFAADFHGAGRVVFYAENEIS